MQRDVAAKVYEFNGFRLEGMQRRLLYRGQPVPLKGKILDLLLFLVEMRGQLVLKEDLMKKIWPDAIVEENNITVSMSILRKTLGEDRYRPKFIETVPRQGYRFIAEVTEVSPERPETRETRQSPDKTELQDEPINSLAVLPLQSPKKTSTSSICRTALAKASSTYSREFRNFAFWHVARSFVLSGRRLILRKLVWRSTSGRC